MNFLDSVGRSTIDKVEYVGGLTIQFWRGLVASWRVNPITGSRLRWKTTVQQMAVIGVHGILSGTSTTDFGGSKNAGAAVGIVDGMVYLGTGIQSVVIGNIAPVGDAAKDPANWWLWPVFLIPFAVIGMGLSLKIWNALPKKVQRTAETAAA